MQQTFRSVLNWKAGLFLSGVFAIVLGAGPRSQQLQVEAEAVVPIELDLVRPVDEEAQARRVGELLQISESEMLAEFAQHEIGISLANDRVSVLVHFEPVIARDAAPRLDVHSFATDRQAVVKYEYGAVLPNVINLRNLPEDAIAELENMPGVISVEIDEYHPNLVRLHDATGLVNGLQGQIAAAGLSADGAGIRVCIADTGIDTDHVMYADRIDSAAGHDFYNDDSNPEDDNGHGSHVSGIAVGGVGLSVDFGCGAGSQEFQGMAPAATLIGAKILNSVGGGFDSDIIAGINHCADQSPSGGQANVINLSIGTGAFTSGACTHSWAVAANNAVANGVVVVAASGNENNSNAMGSPACGTDVIAVGATYKADYPTCEDTTTNWLWGSCNDFGPVQDQIVCFSNESDFLDVSAPGSNIWSASNAAGGSSITGQSGTSMASPMVAGLAALILSADPSLTPAEVRQIIRDGAIDMGSAGFDRAYGWGRIDAIASLELVDTGCTVPADCDDNDACNGLEDCVAGSCVAGTPLNCDDGVFCNGAETCDAIVGCQAGTPPSCDDGVGCTDDSCNGGTDSCDNIANDANCPDDGLFCNGSESCDAVSDCVSSGDPCTGGSTCNEATDTCDTPVCNNDGTCDAGEDCNNCPSDCISGSGATCGNGVCEAGDGEDCVSCPSDCDGRQSGKPSNRFCCGDGGGQNAILCDSTTPECNGGGFSCTDVPASGSCCGDATCEGSEDGSNCAIDCACIDAADCDDGIGCTNDDCVGGFCDNVPNDANCADDGQFCNGSEFCDGSADCSSTGDPCGSGENCNEATDACDACTPKNGSCSSGAECCSGTCKGNGRCR